jgi:hypothetical protein
VTILAGTPLLHRASLTARTKPSKRHPVVRPASPSKSPPAARSEIATVILPFFGLIACGFGATRLLHLSAQGVGAQPVTTAMPAWFFHHVAATPFGAIEHWSFLAATAFATYCAFALAFSLGALLNRGNVPEETVEGLAGSYANIGYLAPALTVAALGPTAGAATALVFAFDHALLFIIVPLMMALGAVDRSDRSSIGRDIVQRVFLHPFVLAAGGGLLFSLVGVGPPGPAADLVGLLSDAAPPVALFAVGAGLARSALVA